MTQLVHPQQKSTSSSLKASNKNSIKVSSQYSRLGYEVLHRSRQSERISSTLLLSQGTDSSASTGSALLDAFERDRLKQATPLQNLNLIKIAGSSNQQNAEELGHSASPPPVTVLIKTDSRQRQPDQPSVEKLLSDPPSEGNIQPGESRIENLPSQETQLPTQTSFDKSAATRSSSLPQAEINQLEPFVSKTGPSNPQIAAPAKSKSAPSKPSPPASNLPVPPIRSLPSQSGKRLGTAMIPSTGTMARDSAAAVGLLDLNDPLLFGGDQDALVCMDPFVDRTTAAGPEGVLTYLSQQVSAFTVTRLSNNYPINTHIATLNKTDDPKRYTVLALNDFRLSELTEDAESKAKTNQQAESSLEKGRSCDSHTNADVNTDVADLTKQLQALNRRVEDISRQLKAASHF